MIASWMLYLLAVSTLLAMAAHALDRSLVAARRPTRLVWAAAIALALA